MHAHLPCFVLVMYRRISPTAIRFTAETVGQSYDPHLTHYDVIKWKHFRVTGRLWGESTIHWWIPLTKWRGALKFSLFCAWTNGWAINRDIGSLRRHHYDDVIVGAMASQITSLTIVYSTVNSDIDQRKHQSSASLSFVWGIHRGPVNSPLKWPVTRKMFPIHDAIMIALIMSVMSHRGSVGTLKDMGTCVIRVELIA